MINLSIERLIFKDDFIERFYSFRKKQIREMEKYFATSVICIMSTFEKQADNNGINFILAEGID